MFYPGSVRDKQKWCGFGFAREAAKRPYVTERRIHAMWIDLLLFLAGLTAGPGVDPAGVEGDGGPRIDPVG